jgi:hypothetical protein
VYENFFLRIRILSRFLVASLFEMTDGGFKKVERGLEKTEGHSGKDTLGRLEMGE